MIPIKAILIVALTATPLAAQLLTVQDAEILKTTRTTDTVRVVSNDGTEFARATVEGPESDPQRAPTKLILVNTRAANVRMTFENRQRENVQDLFIDLGESRWTISTPGEYWVRCLAVDFNLNIFDEQQIRIKVGNGPNPPPIPPGPQPEPGEFDNIAQRVSAASQGLSRNQQLGSLFAEMAGKMARFEILRISDAKKVFEQQSAQYLPEYQAVFEMLGQDAKTRLMGWQETIRYYSAIAEGFGVAGVKPIYTPVRPRT